MKKSIVWMILLLSLCVAAKPNCDFLGDSASKWISKSASLQEKCSDFAKGYKSAKVKAKDVDAYEANVKAFQYEAKACQASVCLESSFDKINADFSKGTLTFAAAKPKVDYVTVPKSNSHLWGIFGIVLLCTMALYVRFLKWIPNVLIVIGSILPFMAIFSGFSWILVMAMVLSVFNFKMVKTRCPKCKTLGSENLGSTYHNLIHMFEKKTGEPITKFRERIHMHCHACESDWVRGGHTNTTRKGHFYPD